MSLSTGNSQRVRDLAVRKYVIPSARRRASEFSIPVRALLTELRESGFPARNTPQICTAIRSRKFLDENNLEIDRVEGPPSGQSTTVTVHYRFRQSVGHVTSELPEHRAKRILRASAGLLQPAINKHGGAVELLRWIRSEDAQ